MNNDEEFWKVLVEKIRKERVGGEINEALGSSPIRGALSPLPLAFRSKRRRFGHYSGKPLAQQSWFFLRN